MLQHEQIQILAEAHPGRKVITTRPNRPKAEALVAQLEDKGLAAGILKQTDEKGRFFVWAKTGFLQGR